MAHPPPPPSQVIWSYSGGTYPPPQIIQNHLLERATPPKVDDVIYERSLRELGIEMIVMWSLEWRDSYCETSWIKITVYWNLVNNYETIWIKITVYGDLVNN